MTASLLDNFLSTAAMAEVFDDTRLVQAMCRFESALARAQAAEGLIPPEAAITIGEACAEGLHDLPALAAASRQAGSLAIPLVRTLTDRVARVHPQAAGFVHLGSTSQDVIDTGLVLVTRDALALLDDTLATLLASLLGLAHRHRATPVLARTLLQPAQVTSLGLKFANWAAPLVRARARLRASARAALALQLGGAVGTLAVMGEKGPPVAARVAAELGLRLPPAPWHTQRDDWVDLGLQVAVLVGSLGKIATDLSLMAQGEIGELAEPAGSGRGGSSAMPHKRNPVSCMTALAAAKRAPQRAAVLLAAMPQAHERGLGDWQAELAEWPGLFLSAHGAADALREACGGLQVDAPRMRRNIDALQGLVFAEAAASLVAPTLGKAGAHRLLEGLSARTVAEGAELLDLLLPALDNDPKFAGIDRDAVRAAFEAQRATAPAEAMALRLLAALEADNAALPEAPWRR